MKKRIAAGIGAAVAAVIVGSVGFAALREGSMNDPENARCNAPSIRFQDEHSYADRTEVEVRFTCVGADIYGSLAIPPGRGRHPAVVWVHGSGEAERLTYSGAPLVRALVQRGVAVLSYDKRGVGESGGECCPGDSGQFNLVAADAAGALNVLAARPEIDPDRLGLIGASQAGWIVPLAAARTDIPVAFTALVDAPVVSYGQEQLYSHLTGEEGDGASDLSLSAVIDKVRDAAPSGFDPSPYLRTLRCPSLWLYGSQDLSQPTAVDLQVLARLRAEAGSGFRAVVFPADHGLLDVPPSDPDALSVFVRWIQRTAASEHRTP